MCLCEDIQVNKRKMEHDIRIVPVRIIGHCNHKRMKMQTNREKNMLLHCQLWIW